MPEQLPAGYEKISSYSDTDFVLTNNEEFNVQNNMFKCAEGYDGTATVDRCTSIPGNVVFSGCAKNTVRLRATSTSVLLNGVMDFLGSLESSQPNV